MYEEGFAQSLRSFAHPSVTASKLLLLPRGSIEARRAEGASAPCRSVSEMRSIEATEAPDGAERNRHAPGGSCEAAGDRGWNPERNAKRLRMQALLR